MSTAKPGNQDNTPNEGKMDLSQVPSSPGDSPVAQTPKDVHPGDAAARDMTQRNVNSDDPAERLEALLDEASELSFPASDPIAVPPIAKLEEETGNKSQPRDKRDVAPKSPAPGRRH